MYLKILNIAILAKIMLVSCILRVEGVELVKANSPGTNDVCERFNKTMQNEPCVTALPEKIDRTCKITIIA